MIGFYMKCNTSLKWLNCQDYVLITYWKSMFSHHGKLVNLQFLIVQKPVHWLKWEIVTLMGTSALNLSWRWSLWYRNQPIDGGPYHIETIPLICRANPIDLQSESMDWFLYNRGLRYERVSNSDQPFKGVGSKF